ncbi:lamin tail domain-containing protein [Myxococcota bacterium]|nr:lamin tail domain-containing protein [Myxococcota bacterium]
MRKFLFSILILGLMALNAGCDETNSSSQCGDGILDPGEECDQNDLANESCSTQGYWGGVLTCTDDCTFDRSDCEPHGYCGDGTIQAPNEVCDGATLGGATCGSLAYSGGVLSCHENCTYDTTGCIGDEDCTDGIDNDDDGLVDCNDPDCADQAPDADMQDGVCAGAKKVCNTSDGGWVEPDYTQITGYEALEVSCDTLDNDCNGQVDEGLSVEYYPDADHDGHGDQFAQPTVSCESLADHVTNNDDCDDSDDQKHPGLTEVCDGKDNDCNGDVDDGLLVDYYPDMDHDGFGDRDATPVASCDPVTDHVIDHTDCNDGDGESRPGLLEICDGKDNDCDGVIDAGSCQAHAVCFDNGGTASASCRCDLGFVELPSDPGVCQEARPVASGVRELAVTEIMIQPLSADSTALGQYVEFKNTTDATLNLMGVALHLSSSVEDATATITLPTLLAPGAYFVIGASDDTGVNGGYTPDLAFATMPLLRVDSGTAELVHPDGSLQDTVAWHAAFNHAAGAALQLTPAALSGNVGTLNDSASHWCHARFSTLTDGDFGTPGAINDDCLPTWCSQPSPFVVVTSTMDYSSGIYGRVEEPGLTEAAGQGPFITAQVGYGPVDSFPDDSWNWTSTNYTSDHGNADQYNGFLSVSITGIYDMAYRMSMDGGLSWLPCDMDGVSRDGVETYDPSNSSTLTVWHPIFMELTAGDAHTCGIRMDDTLWCWGDNTSGQLGDGTTTSHSSPVQVPGAWSSVDAGGSHTCGINTDGTLLCWGDNANGQLGDGTTINKTTPTTIGPDWEWISAGAQHTCGINSGRIHCWGNNSHGQIGDGTTTSSAVPVFIDVAVGWQLIVAGTTHTCGLTSAWQAYCWGDNSHGQLGDGTTTNHTSPVLVTPVSGTYSEIKVGQYHTCSIVGGDELYCWGGNASGQLGDGTTTDNPVPTQIPGSWMSFLVGASFTCGNAQLDQTYCWGDNGAGQFGIGASGNYYSPEPVSSDLDFGAGGASHACFFHISDGFVYCAGDNTSGQLGDGTTTSSPTPVQVPNI